MPQKTERLSWRFMGGLIAGKGRASASSSFTSLAQTGYQTMSGCARVTKEVYIGPFDFYGPSPSPLQVSGCTPGSVYPASLLVDITGSAFAGMTASMITIRALNMGAGASPASTLKAFAYVPRPTDADTTGSIIVLVDWTYGDAPATGGSTNQMLVALGYLGGAAGTASAVRTAASAGGTKNASYNGTTCGLWQSTCVGKLPSFGTSDTGLLVALAYGASGAAESGVLSTGCIYILSVRLRYTACAIGYQSTE